MRLLDVDLAEPPPQLDVLGVLLHPRRLQEGAKLLLRGGLSRGRLHHLILHSMWKKGDFHLVDSACEKEVQEFFIMVETCWVGAERVRR